MVTKSADSRSVELTRPYIVASLSETHASEIIRPDERHIVGMLMDRGVRGFTYTDGEQP